MRCTSASISTWWIFIFPPTLWNPSDKSERTKALRHLITAAENASSDLFTCEWGALWWMVGSSKQQRANWNPPSAGTPCPWRRSLLAVLSICLFRCFVSAQPVPGWRCILESFSQTCGFHFPVVLHRDSAKHGLYGSTVIKEETVRSRKLLRWRSRPLSKCVSKQQPQLLSYSFTHQLRLAPC